MHPFIVGVLSSKASGLMYPFIVDALSSKTSGLMYPFIADALAMAQYSNPEYKCMMNLIC